MQEPIEYEYGDQTLEVRVYDDGRFDCPKCSWRTVWESLDNLSVHLSTAHDIDPHKTDECPVCGDEFQYRGHKEQTYCSHSCATTAQNRQRAATGEYQ